MESIGIIGQTDSNGMILCVSRLINQFGKKIIFVDASSQQRTRYTVPQLRSRQEQNLVQYDGIEVAIGFNNLLELKKYMITKGEDFNDYDYILISTDREEMCEEYDLKNANHLFFSSTLDKFELNRGIDLLKYVCATKRRESSDAMLKLTKILTYTELKSDSDVHIIEDLAKDLPIEWQPEVLLNYDDGDLSVYIQNQYSNKVEFKKLSKNTKEGLAEIVRQILGEDKNRIHTAIKTIERNARFSA